MQRNPAVVILANDRVLAATTASELSRHGCSVRMGRRSGSERAALIVRDCRDRRILPEPDVPVLTVDLSVLNGDDLAEVVFRVLGLAPPSSAVALSAFLLILQGRVPEA